MINQAFASFPTAGGEGAYQRIDVNVIEAIGQSIDPTVATIFGPTDRFYQVMIPQQWLSESGLPDATAWIEATMHQAVEESFAAMKGAALRQFEA